MNHGLDAIERLRDELRARAHGCRMKARDMTTSAEIYDEAVALTEKQREHLIKHHPELQNR